MSGTDQKAEIRLALEAPGEFLSGLLGVSAGGEITAAAGGFRSFPEAQGSWRIVAPLSGRLRLAWTDQVWVMEGRQAAAFSGAEELSLLALEDCRVLWICLVGSAADAVFRDCIRQGGLFFENGGLALERLIRLLSGRQGRPVTGREASEYAYQFLMTIWGTGESGPAERRKLPPVAEAALGIMQRDYAFLDGVAELADRLEVSQEYLTRCFTKAVGITPGKYLTQLRIESAKLLLRQGGHSVQFVSDACGFSNGNYFARVFRSIVGMNPRDYARQESAQQEQTAHNETFYVL